MSAEELRALIRDLLPCFDDALQARFTTELVDRAARNGSGWVPDGPGGAAVERIEAFDAAAERVPDKPSARGEFLVGAALAAQTLERKDLSARLERTNTKQALAAVPGAGAAAARGKVPNAASASLISRLACSTLAGATKIASGTASERRPSHPGTFSPCGGTKTMEGGRERAGQRGARVEVIGANADVRPGARRIDPLVGQRRARKAVAVDQQAAPVALDRGRHGGFQPGMGAGGSTPA